MVGTARLNSPKVEIPDLAAMMSPAYRGLLGNDRSTSETGHGSDEAMDGSQFCYVADFLRIVRLLPYRRRAGLHAGPTGQPSMPNRG